MSQPINPTHPYTLNPGAGWTYRYSIDFTVKAGEKGAGRGAAFMEYTTRKGEEPSPHSHPTEDEMFYILQGSVTFHCDGETFQLEQGGFIFLPQGSQHGYTIHNDDPVRFIVVTAPAREGQSGGWGGFIADLETGQGELIASPQEE